MIVSLGLPMAGGYDATESKIKINNGSSIILSILPQVVKTAKAGNVKNGWTSRSFFMQSVSYKRLVKESSTESTIKTHTHAHKNHDFDVVSPMFPSNSNSLEITRKTINIQPQDRERERRRDLTQTIRFQSTR